MFLSRLPSKSVYTSAHFLLGKRRLVSTRPTDWEALLEHPAHGISCISLKQPKFQNTVSIRLLKELQSHLTDVHNDKSAQVLILRLTAQDSLCDGARGNEFPSFLAELRLAMYRLENFPVPSFSVLDGDAINGRFELSLSCVTRIAGSTVKKIGTLETSMNLKPDHGLASQVRDRAMRAKAIDNIPDRLFTAQEAWQWGILDAPPNMIPNAFDIGLGLAHQIVQNSPMAQEAKENAANGRTAVQHGISNYTLTRMMDSSKFDKTPGKGK